MMTCCFPGGGVLTRAEREAITRLREQRAQGNVPRRAAYNAGSTRPDPLVTFYQSSLPRPVPKPRPQPRPQPPPRPKMTAHQMKKQAARRREEQNRRQQLATPSSTTQSAAQSSSSSPWKKVIKPSFVTPSSVPSPWENVKTSPRKEREERDTFSDGEESLPTLPSTGKALVERVKGMGIWQSFSKNKLHEEEEDEIEVEVEGNKLNTSQKLKLEVKRKWDDVFDKLGGHKAEQFVMKDRPDVSDFGENDRYFQELMRET